MRAQTGDAQPHVFRAPGQHHTDGKERGTGRQRVEAAAQLTHDRAGFGLEAPALAGADVLLDEQSVTATENALLCSVLAPGRTVIRNAASEPHVQELSMVLVQMGARIHGIGTNTLEVRGVPRAEEGGRRAGRLGEGIRRGP